MKRTETLKNNFEFRRVYLKGDSFKHPALILYLIKNRAGICRIGITTSKKIGNAVERNRCRRIIRAAYSSIEDRIEGNYDFVLVARTKTVFLKSTDIENILLSQMQQAGVIRQ